METSKPSLENRIENLEKRLKELEDRKPKLERAKINIIPKSNLNKNESFEKNLPISDDAIAFIIGVNFFNNSTTGSGRPHNLTFQIYQKNADQNGVASVEFLDPHVYCNSLYSEVIIPFNNKNPKIVVIQYDRTWNDTSPVFQIDLVGILRY